MYSSGYYQEPSLLEKKVNTIMFFFSAPSLCSQLLYKCRLLITLENSSGPTKCSCENACMCSESACMCSLVSAIAAREESVIFFFSTYLLLVSSADNLFQTTWTQVRPNKTFLREIAFMKSHMSQIRWWRETDFNFLSARSLSLFICPLLVVIL